MGTWLLAVSTTVAPMRFATKRPSFCWPESAITSDGGVGEVGEVGVAAAIANALYHATGKRLRRLPVHADDLLA
jgi:hypothetical protein